MKMFRSSNGLLLSREKFSSETSIFDRKKNGVIYEEDEEVESKHLPLARLRSKTRYEDDSIGKTKRNFRHSMSTLPARFNKMEEKQMAAVRKISSLENPFTFSVVFNDPNIYSKITKLSL